MGVRHRHAAVEGVAHLCGVVGHIGKVTEKGKVLTDGVGALLDLVGREEGREGERGRERGRKREGQMVGERESNEV